MMAHGTVSRRRRGVVLIVVLGVLALLALLATTFSQTSLLDRTVASGYLDQVRAKLVARAGVEVGVGTLVSLASSELFTDPKSTGRPSMDAVLQYWGNNLLESGVPDWQVPLEQAQNPSFALEVDGDPAAGPATPRTFELDGRLVGISGAMDGAYAPNGDVYRLRVEDGNSKIFVNDGLEGGRTGPVSRNLERILDVLCDVKKVPRLGAAILDRRPLGGYRSKKELEQVIGPSLYPHLGGYLTTVAWQDAKVVNPVPLSAEAASSTSLYPVHYNQSIGRYRYGRSATTRAKICLDGNAGPEHAIVALDEVNAQWIERSKRAPVNVNGAPKEVLQALIANLRGWFVMEKRKSNPYQKNVYDFIKHGAYTYQPGAPLGCEYGYVYATEPISLAKAGEIADEIIACRTRQSTKVADYSKVWFGGPFRTWRQFNAFCDHLVAAGVLADGRTFYDFRASSGAATGSHTADVSPIQPKVASQAMADVLKANFNPNCTLNELNPDANLFLLVDKTDLMVNSTEFCFTSMGYYDIESEGLVLRTEGGKDFLAAAQADVLARKRVSCQVKIFDVVRHTTQADFAAGTLGRAPFGAVATNNGKSMEHGPEPAAGPAHTRCQWSGWLQLPTVGGMNHGSFGAFSSQMHSHFTYDLCLHERAAVDPDLLKKGAVAGDRKPGGSPGHYYNLPDWSQGPGGPSGPYDLTGAYDEKGSYVADPKSFRQARDWPTNEYAYQYYAPSDHRIDGVYAERGSSVMFEMDPASFGAEGTVAMWVKPSFFPEMMGKPRTWFSVETKWPNSKASGDYTGTATNCLYLFASHDARAGEASASEAKKYTYSGGSFRPISLLSGLTIPNGGRGLNTGSLNHIAHKDAPTAVTDNLLRHHRWSHVIYSWKLAGTEMNIAVNGKFGAAINSTDVKIHGGNALDASVYAQPTNRIRLGEPSVNTPHNRNWSADVTFDEFYLWKSWKFAEAREMWLQGRYHRAYRAGGADRRGTFESAPIDFFASATSASSREPAPVAHVLPPGGAMTTGGTATQPPKVARILGIAWTSHGEDVATSGASAGAPILYDYQTQLQSAPAEFRVTAEVKLKLNGSELAGVAADDRGTSVMDVAVLKTDTLSYVVRLGVEGNASTAIFLATPVIDDVTLYYTTGVQYLYYAMDETSV